MDFTLLKLLWGAHQRDVTHYHLPCIPLADCNAELLPPRSGTDVCRFIYWDCVWIISINVHPLRGVYSASYKDIRVTWATWNNPFRPEEICHRRTPSRAKRMSLSPPRLSSLWHASFTGYSVERGQNKLAGTQSRQFLLLCSILFDVALGVHHFLESVSREKPMMEHVLHIDIKNH